jgi:hypothetical protein
MQDTEMQDAAPTADNGTKSDVKGKAKEQGLSSVSLSPA